MTTLVTTPQALKPYKGDFYITRGDGSEQTFLGRRYETTMYDGQIRVIVHKGEYGGWVVSDYITGLKVTGGDTRNEALLSTKDIETRRTIHNYLDCMHRAIDAFGKRTHAKDEFTPREIADLPF